LSAQQNALSDYFVIHYLFLVFFL